ncbi:hypothetical protein ACFQ60_16920 [Streptomyces zhihengii]
MEGAPGAPGRRLRGARRRHGPGRLRRPGTHHDRGHHAHGVRRPSPTASPTPSPTPTTGALPDAYDFTPDPARVPRTAERARELTRNASLEPADWTPGMVRHDPYENAGTRPLLPDSCVWTRTALPPGMLDSYTRRIDMPAKDGKGRVQGSSP